MRSRKWPVFLMVVYALLALRLERRPLLHPGHALALLGFVAATALVLWPASSPWTRRAWLVLITLLAVAEIHEARSYRHAEGTFVLGRVLPDGQLTLQRKGPATLRDVTLRVIDHTDLQRLHANRADDVQDYQAVVQTMQLGNFLVSTPKQERLLPLVAHGGAIRYQLFFSADSGQWWEALELRPVNGQWREAVRLWRYQGSTPVLMYAADDAGFPAPESLASWKWATEVL